MSHKIVSTESAPSAVGPYSQGCIAGNLLFISGQLPIDPDTGVMLTEDIGAATSQCMKNIFAVLEAANKAAHLVKVTIFLTDMGLFEDVNKVYARFFDDAPPARSCIEVSGLPKNSSIEIEAIAVLPIE